MGKQAMGRCKKTADRRNTVVEPRLTTKHRNPFYLPCMIVTVKNGKKFVVKPRTSKKITGKLKKHGQIEKNMVFRDKPQSN
jgi:hypothetical protein